MTTRAFTGFHMALCVGGFFGVIIAVNITLAVIANTTWSGLIVNNGYVASQEYNGVLARAREQQALGWQSELVHADGSLDFTITRRDGGAIEGLDVRAKITRPTHENEDVDVAFARAPNGRYLARPSLGAGQWIVDVVAIHSSGTTHRRIFRLWVEPTKV